MITSRLVNIRFCGRLQPDCEEILVLLNVRRWPGSRRSVYTLLVGVVEMIQDPDDKFFDRADAHIQLSNDQLKDVSSGKASASMMYATARFNAWVSACGFQNSNQMKAARDETIEYFVTGYQKMLEENFDHYIDNFERYMKKQVSDGL